MKEQNRQLTEELIAVLKGAGADLVGIGNLETLDAEQTLAYPLGVSVAVKFPDEVILEVEQQPTERYSEAVSALNRKLNEIVLIAEAFLKEKGYEAYAQTTDRITYVAERVSRLPHKTVATRAGLGWIGKHCLLVTPEFGSAIRLSSLLTNAPLVCAEPIDKSRCGDCSRCVDVCPMKALKNTLWEVGVPRAEIVNIETCTNRSGPCGRCFANCTYTQNYLQSAGIE